MSVKYSIRPNIAYTTQQVSHCVSSSLSSVSIALHLHEKAFVGRDAWNMTHGVVQQAVKKQAHLRFICRVEEPNQIDQEAGSMAENQIKHNHCDDPWGRNTKQYHVVHFQQAKSIDVRLYAKQSSERTHGVFLPRQSLPRKRQSRGTRQIPSSWAKSLATGFSSSCSKVWTCFLSCSSLVCRAILGNYLLLLLALATRTRPRPRAIT